MINPKAVEAILKNFGSIRAVISRRRGKTTFTPGTLVRMSQTCIREMSPESGEHVEEFRGCIGHVEGPSECGEPHLDVRWHVSYCPTGLRYAYPPHYLERVK